MKKMCNRVLAMLLTLVLTLMALPLSVFADTWLDVEAENKQNGNVASSDITVTLAAKDLLLYIKDGDMSGILHGIAVEGLRGAVSAEELFDIIPKEQFTAIIEAIASDIDPEEIMGYLDVDALIESVDMDRLVEMLKSLPDVDKYIKDFDALMKYVDEDKVANALDCIDVNGLVKNYAGALLDIALTLDADELVAIVDVDAAIKLEGINYSELINTDYFKNLTDAGETLTGYQLLMEKYISESALHQFILDNHDDERWEPSHLHAYANEEVLKSEIQKGNYNGNFYDYLKLDLLRGLIDGLTGVTYESLKADGILVESTLIDMLKTGGYASFEGYVDVDAAVAILEGEIDSAELAGYYDGTTLKVADVVNSALMTPALYAKLLSDAVDTDAMLFGNGAYNVEKLVRGGAIDAVKVAFGDKRLFDVEELEAEGVINFETVLFGDGVVGSPCENGLFDLADLLAKDAFDISDMLSGKTEDGVYHAPLFDLSELVAEEIVLEDKLIANNHTYGKTVDIKALEEKLKKLLADEDLFYDDLLDCLVKDANGDPDYAAALKAVGGVPAVIAKTDLTYAIILRDYVTDFPALMEKLGVEGIVKAIVKDGKINVVFDVKGLIKALGLRDLIKLVDIKAVAKQLYNKEAIVAILDSLTPEKYLACLSDILDVLSKNVVEVKINGIAVTYKPYSDILQIDSDGLLRALQSCIPTLHDLATLDDEGTVASFSFAITYASEGTGGVAKTKEVSLTLKLDGGAADIRRLASKLENLIGRYATYSYNNGKLTLDLRLPNEFATAIKYVLHQLGSDADPELVKLKDEILDLYDANLSDMANFVDNITVDQIVTILEKVDSEHFNRAFDAAMRQKYVATVIDYLESVTGVDLSKVDLIDILERVADMPALPTVEQIANKVEDITGYDIVSKLPVRVQNVWRTVEGELLTDVLSKVIARAGYDVDIQGLLDDAMASEDPIQYLYDTAVTWFEDHRHIYGAVKDKALSVFDILMSSRYGEKLDSYRIRDFYRGDGVFSFDASVTFSPESVLKRGINKLLNYVLSKRDFDTKYIDKALTIVYALLTDDTVTVGLDASLKVTDLYKVTFLDENGNVIRRAFLPYGTKLSLIQDYTPADPAHTFIHWKDAEANELTYYSYMPQKDVYLMADVDTGETPVVEFTVKIVDPFGNLVKTITVQDGATLESYRAELEALVGPLTPTQTLTWHKVLGDVTSDVVYDWSAEVHSNMTLTWKITDKEQFTVTVVAPDALDTPLWSTTVYEDENLLAFREVLEALALNGQILGAEDEILWHRVYGDTISDTLFNLGSKVTENVVITWDIVRVNYYNVTVDVYDEYDNFLFNDALSVREGRYLTSIRGEFRIHDNEAYPKLDKWEKVLYQLIDVWTLADGSAFPSDTTKVTEDIALKVVVTRDHANASLRLEDTHHSEYAIQLVGDNYVLTWNANEWADNMKLVIEDSFIAHAITEGHGLEMDSADAVNGHSIVLDNALLKNLLDTMISRGAESVTLDYSLATEGAYAENSGAAYFNFSFLFDGVAIGDFFGDGKVTIRLPYEGKNSPDVKTFLYVDGVDCSSAMQISAGSVVIDAPHFSEFTLVDKYYLSYDAYRWENVDPNLVKNPPNLEFVATLPIAEGFYAAGEVLTVNDVTLVNGTDGMQYLRTEIRGATNVTIDGMGTYVMPAEAVTLQHVVTARTYYIYFYVNEAVDSYLAYTKFAGDAIPTWAEIAAYVPTATVPAGGEWFGMDTSLNLETNPQDVYLFMIWAAPEKSFTLNFNILAEDGSVATSVTLTHTVKEWLDLYLAQLTDAINAELGQNKPAGTIVWMANGKALTDYTTADWATVMNGTESSLTFVADVIARDYTVITDGNVTLDIVGDSAAAGTEIKVTVIEREGMKAIVSIKANGTDVPFADGKFVMPAGDVTITVTYEKKTYSYTDAQGNAVADVPYGNLVTYTVVVPAGKTIIGDLALADLNGAPVGLTLIATSTDAQGNVTLTFAFTMNDANANVDLKAFNETVQLVIGDLQYVTYYVVEGVAYTTEAEALKNLPVGSVFVSWEKVGENMFVAALDYVEEADHTALIILIIVLVLLILILLIGMFYTLYVGGKIGASWFTKFITSIVSAFFALCMGVAAAGVAILRLFGYEEKDVAEDDEK